MSGSTERVEHFDFSMCRASIKFFISLKLSSYKTSKLTQVRRTVDRLESLVRDNLLTNIIDFDQMKLSYSLYLYELVLQKIVLQKNSFHVIRA